MQMNENGECRVCGLMYDPSDEGDIKNHKTIHKKLASGVQPRKVREFSKAFGWAVACNDGGLDRLKSDYINSDPEIGKLAIAFSWWSRALDYGVPVKDFDSYMDAHLKFIDALASKNGDKERNARLGIKKWERFAG